MEKSRFTHRIQCPCGCNGGGLGESTGYARAGCGCEQGLGEEPTAGTGKEAPETQKDLISEAKKYINGEIPMGYKIATGIGVATLLILATRGG